MESQDNNTTIPEMQDATQDSHTILLSQLDAQFHRAAGYLYKMPHLDFLKLPHKCILCQRQLHGPCGVLHDPDSVTYHNRCYVCNLIFFAKSHKLKLLHMKDFQKRSPMLFKHLQVLFKLLYLCVPSTLFKLFQWRK
jgi:hypothetical protein